MKALVVNLAKALFGTLGIKALVPLARLLWRYAVATWRVLLRPVLRVLLPPALVAGVVWGLNQPIPEAIKRDVLLALKAHQLAGELVPFDPDYIESRVYDPDQTWGMTTNSRWLLDTTLRIVPMFEYERMAGSVCSPNPCGTTRPLPCPSSCMNWSTCRVATSSRPRVSSLNRTRPLPRPRYWRACVTTATR